LTLLRKSFYSSKKVVRSTNCPLGALARAADVVSEKKAIVLLSGGVDSSTALAIAKREGGAVAAVTFDYGQRHRKELEAAQRVARALGVERHFVLSFDLRAIGGSALTDELAVPKGRSPAEIAAGIPVTYVPARNTIFLSFALAVAERIEAQEIFFGANQLDYSGYPDCREEYVRAFEAMANLATKAGVEGKLRMRIRTPLIRMSKAEIIREGTELGLDYALTWSCYDPTPGGLACGRCDACQLRLKGFREAGIQDPLAYATAELI
jgi:7-cyano-7-deazaguanine synthase